MAFPEKKYDRLYNLWERWGISQDDVYYAIENDLLRVCIYLPLRFVERGVIKDNKFIFERHEHKHGFIAVRSEDFRLICSKGSAKLRIFHSIRTEGHILRLAMEPPQPSVLVRVHDLIVLREDRQKFEETYDIRPRETTVYPATPGIDGTFRYSNDYRHVTMDNQEFHLGDVQARIVGLLHEAACSRSPWVHGKILLYDSGAKTTRMRDLFKLKKHWEHLLNSNERGYYRLNLPQHEFDYHSPSLTLPEGIKAQRNARK
ncbi:MAG: hypothetical protein DI582_10800 [Azospirillum brasilense]|nr:MAG: hypothetical protein DI582_10800 [Azospirillum brasilense]